MSKKKSLVEQIFDGEIHVSEQINPHDSKNIRKNGKKSALPGNRLPLPLPLPGRRFLKT